MTTFETLPNLSRRGLLGLGAGATAVWALASCATDDSSGGGGGKALTGATITLGSTAITSAIDPHAATSNVGRTYAINVFDALVAFDGDGKIAPSLATEWNRADDTTLELTLRDGVTFHSGAAFDGAAVQANVERILSGDPAYSLLVGRLGPITGVEVVEPLKVRISTSSPDPILLNRLTMIDIVDPAMIGADVSVETISGTGPFRVVGYTPSQEVRLERFEEAWQPSESIKSATLVAISDPSALAIAARAGDVDAAFGLPPDQANQLASSHEVQTPSAGSCAICSLIPDVEPKLADPRVREALNMAINHEEFVEAGLGGHGTVSTGQLLQPGYQGYDEALEGFAYDPDAAKALLEEAGATDLELPIVTTSFFKAQAEIVVGYLAAIGVKSRVELQDISAFLGTLLSKSDFPLVYWQTDYFDLQDILSVTRFGPQAPGTQLHFDSPEYAALYEQVAVELDETKRAELIRQMAGILREEAGVLFLGWPKLAFVHAKNVDLRLGGSSLINLQQVVRTA
ncbi:ABC transporter substrate-binding protein [Nocardioides pantholopis]|uniref:ABC transporter substrate-binding protein n=1 Tax=Nocardioides pantholopis TaxID=2483798 RepID=UPI000F08D6B7|nr:ABC transporter substrate-binding protein [Nocardioides pantholopis]